MPREKSPQVMNFEVLDSLGTKILPDIVKCQTYTICTHNNNSKQQEKFILCSD